jgi:hypothetical protein
LVLKQNNFHFESLQVTRKACERRTDGILQQNHGTFGNPETIGFEGSNLENVSYTLFVVLCSCIYVEKK